MKRFTFLLFFCVSAFSTVVSASEVITLNDGWYFHRGFQASASDKAKVDLPHTWNTSDGMFGNTDYYRGICNYTRTLKIPASYQGKRIFLRVQAAQTVADVFVNHRFVTQHKGGYTAFVAELTDYVTPGEESVLDIRVNNGQTMDVAPVCGDFNIFGGLYRGIELIVTDDVCITPDYYASSGVFFTQSDVSEQHASLKIETLLSAKTTSMEGCEVEFQLYDKNRLLHQIVSTEIDGTDRVVMNMTLDHPHLWNGVNDPYLYQAVVILRKNGVEIDRREEAIGFRYYHVDSEKGFFLNGKPYRLNGVNRHQDRAERATAMFNEDHDKDLDLIQEMGCNSIRLCHYPQAKYVHQQMDRRGLVAWVEIPFVNVYINNPSYDDNLRQQLTELIVQNYNHPSILFWGLFNEINSGWLDRPSQMVKNLHALAHQLDSQRLTMGASNQDDDFNGTTDLIAFNKYFGWYDDKIDKMGDWIDREHQKHPERKMGISEYGAGACVFQQSDSLVHPEPWGQWHPENWQTYYHITNWRQLQTRQFLWCNYIWCMFDFASAGRREGTTMGRNDKGLVTYDRTTRKDAFYFYKANWNKDDKFVYLPGKRLVKRSRKVIDVQAFSNCGPANLYVNGKSYGTASPDNVNVLEWKGIHLKDGENVIEIRNKYGHDKCVWTHDASVMTNANTVTISPDSGQARIVCLEVMNDNIIRVRATSKDELPVKPASLMILPQQASAKGAFSVSEEGRLVTVKAKNVKAVVDKTTGQVTFYDADGNMLLKEAKEGKFFGDFTVPERELGMKTGYTVPDEAKHGLSWLMRFDSPDDEAFYGLGQHQSEEFNMKGKNEDLFQYNTKVSVPFVLSNKNYGILWDSYSYCRFGNPNDYLQLNRAFKLYDKQGREGHLTGTYIDKDGKKIVRDEDSIYYEYAFPATSEIACMTEDGGLKNLPKGFNLQGASVTYEGFIEAPQSQLYQFILYYAGYIKVYIDGNEVVPERWRTAWNPNSYKFSCELQQGRKARLLIEWQPDGGESYCGLRVAEPRTAKERGQLSIWSEMAKDMDYYFIAGQNLDEVISGYRTLTGRASLYPKWVLGYWQSRERYKSSKEVEETMEEFRSRHIPIDNIVQDWNYWPDDQWGSHQFEALRYPNPQALLDSVHQMHGRFMISVWPKFYCNTDNYKELDAKGWMYTQSPTDDIHDWVGPGFKNGFYDAYDEGARKMFWRQIDENLYTGLSKSSMVRSASPLGSSKNGQPSMIDAWWMDASEPNVKDCTPMWYRKALCGPTALGTSTEYFNAYSIVNADAIYNGQRSVWKGKQNEPRVFLLTRSGFAGEQRFSTATWSGDIGTRWEDMRAQMTAGLNYSMSGIPFWGMDQGGFCVENRYVAAQQLFDRTGLENEDLKEWRELQTRWNQFGTFIPLFRSHGQWPLREIWNIAPDEHPAYKSFVYYDKLRYRLMPYLYSMAGWVHFKDYTLMRALVMDFNGDKQVEDIGNQWMFGPALMACPVGYYKARNRSVYFPKQCGWYNLYTNEYIEGGQRLVVDAPYEQIPVFVCEGAIIPFGPEMEWSDEKPAELINLYVYAGKNGQFQLYEDEGTNYNYEKGKYATIDITYDDGTRTVSFGARKGQFPGMLKQRRFNVVLITRDAPLPLNLENPEGKMVQYDGRAVSVTI